MICVIYFFSLNLCLEIDINTIEREVVYLSCLFISVGFFWFFFCLFQFLDSQSQKFTLSNFDQEVAFNQYFYLYQEFMFVVVISTGTRISGYPNPEYLPESEISYPSTRI